jgi:hypothetical protein
MEPLLELTKSMTESHSRLRSQAFHPYDDECRGMFPKLFKNKLPIGKGEVGGRRREGVRADFMYKLE